VEPDRSDNQKTLLQKDIGASGTRLGEETSTASRLAHEGRDALKRTADEVSSRARAEAEARGEDLKERTTEGLDVFAQAVRTAGDELARTQPGPISDLVTQAARGLEGFSKSLRGSSTGDMLEEIRKFGRHNPGAFIAGSVLAGFALGRFAGSSANHEQSAGRTPTGASSKTREEWQ
jgi:hypothetical protein